MSNEPSKLIESVTKAERPDDARKVREPRRKRGCFAILMTVTALVLAILVLAYLVWWQIERGRLTDVIQKLKDAGEPVELVDLAPPTLADDENAATFYVQAFGLLHGMGWKKHKTIVTVISWPRNASEKQVKQARALIEEYADALKLVREGSRLDRCRYDIDYDAPAYDVQLTHYHWIRIATDLISASSWIKLMDGQGEDAVRDCIAAMKFSRSLHEEPFPYSLLMAEECVEKTLRLLRRVLSGTEIARARLLEMSRTLGDVEDRSDFVWATQGDRCFGMSLVELSVNNQRKFLTVLRRSPPGRSVMLLARLMKPGLTARGAEYIGDASRAVELSELPWYKNSVGWNSLAADMAAKRKSASNFPFLAGLPYWDPPVIQFTVQLKRMTYVHPLEHARNSRLHFGSIE